LFEEMKKQDFVKKSRLYEKHVISWLKKLSPSPQPIKKKTITNVTWLQAFIT